ncbi:MAG: hypothetical protein RIQ54_356 [Candidatus Parcubacteria bacterium]|jgi:hypothetical protein
MKRLWAFDQLVPIGLTVVVFLLLTALLAGEAWVLNYYFDANISLHIRWYDIAIGLTIYLKTSIDFAIFIGRLMQRHTGFASRVAIEIGTAVGNALGTLIILGLWSFFKEIRWLLAGMIVIASLVLFRLAQDGLEHARDVDDRYPPLFQTLVRRFESILSIINGFIAPVLRYVIPHLSVRSGTATTFWGLFAFSFSVPFILGLDDFAGYVPLFSVVNVFGFAIGVFAGHMILNVLLYISPDRTVSLVKNPLISFAGSVAFVCLAVWGLYEVAHLIGF